MTRLQRPSVMHEGEGMNPRLLRRIKLEHRNPPVAKRDFDWCATFEGHEPGDSLGFGKTEQEAVDWLIAEEAHLIATEHSQENEA